MTKPIRISSDLITQAANLVLACGDHHHPASVEFDNEEEVITLLDDNDSVLGTLSY